MEHPVVNLYIQTSVHGPAQHGGRYIYVLEWICSSGQPVTRDAIGAHEDKKETALVLDALADALARLRLPCVLEIYTGCRQVKNAVDNGWLDAWEHNGWQTAKGEDIRHRQQWERVAELLRPHLVTIRAEPHSYSSWMETQLER